MSFGLTDIQGQVFGSALVRVYGANGKQKFPAGGGGVTSVTATSPITSSGGTTPVISTLMNTGKLIGRSTAGSGVMEEITIGSGLSLSGGTLSSSSSGGLQHGTASGTDTYTVTIAGVASYADGDAYLIRFTNGNTTGSTLNINGLGAVTLYRNNDGPLLGGDIADSGEMLCIYNSTSSIFQCIGISPNSLIAYVTNDDSVTITKGQAVYAFSGQGDRMTVKRALNTGDSTSAQTVGLVLSTSIAANQKGFIMMQGLLDGLSILPTATWSDGDPVYLGATAGAITKVKPYAPNHLVYLGVVTTASNGSAGRLYVRVQNGYELDELHNVQAQTPTYKDTLWFDNTVTPSQWKTASISTILGYTPVPSTRTLTINGVAQDLSADRSWTVGNIDLAVISVTSTNAREDDWAPTGWPGTTDIVKVIDFTPNNVNNIISLGGLANPAAGRIVTIVNSSTNNVVIIENEATTSTAANRFKLAQKSPYFLMPEREITFLYTGTRWSQFNTHPNQGGFDFYDDFENINPTVGSQATKMFYGVTSGTGSGLASGAETSDVWGVMRLSAGTTTTGFLYASVDYRRFGGSTIFGVNGLCPQLWVSKVKIDTVPTAAQDWNFNTGLNASSSTVATAGQTGLMWEMPTYASGGATPAFWSVRITNTSGALTILTTTAAPITAATYIYLGIFITSSNFGDAIFFYSTDGVTYNFAYRFTRVSGNYGGLPFYRLAGSVGTLNTRSASVDWCGESFNLKR